MIGQKFQTFFKNRAELGTVLKSGRAGASQGQVILT